MMKKMITGCLILFGALLTGGCASLQVNLLKAAAQKPGNVAFLFSVENAEGMPVGRIDDKSIQILENDVQLSPAVSKQVLLPSSETVAQATMVLVDLQLTTLGAEALQKVAEEVGAFAKGLAQKQPVGIFGFDGSAELTKLTDFTQQEEEINNGLKALTEAKQRDASTNLYGAAVAGVEALKQALSASEKPANLQHLVIIAGSKELARRVSEDELSSKLEVTSVHRYAVGLWPAIDEAQLEALANKGVLMAQHPTEYSAAHSAAGMEMAPLSAVLQGIAKKIEDWGSKLFFLSYCSPLRGGENAVTVRISLGEDEGSFSYDFSADGFGPDCDPYKVPSF